MTSGPLAVLRSRSWRAWGAFLLICVVFAGSRFSLESQRQHHLKEWNKEQELNHKFWTLVGCPFPQVVAALTPGKTMPPTMRYNSHSFQANIAGSSIDPKYTGWELILTFSRRPQSDYVTEDIETLSEMSVTPPPDLPKEPTQLWWGVEHARAGAFWLGGIGWAAGLVLMMSARGTRRQIAPFCLSAALLCMFAAALDLDFSRTNIVRPFRHDRQTSFAAINGRNPLLAAVSNHPAWFDAGGVMAITALVLWLVPTRKIIARQCKHCSYDLTGNISGICPECGSETPAQIRQRRLAEMAPAADRLEHLIEPEGAIVADVADDASLILSPPAHVFPD